MTTSNTPIEEVAGETMKATLDGMKQRRKEYEAAKAKAEINYWNRLAQYNAQTAAEKRAMNSPDDF